jgi:hypothetical protein
MRLAPYPVSYEIARPERYNRWTVGFRLILAIPLLILVSSGGLGGLRGAGPLTALLGTLVVFAWFAILFTGQFPSLMRDTCEMLFRWTLNIDAYLLLLAEPYPPFGSHPYSLTVGIEPAQSYNRWAVGFRIFLVIPHAIALLFLGIAEVVVTLIAWFAILMTGQYPQGMFDFSVGVSRWAARVTAYLYLFVDEYPPFTLEAGPSAAGMQPEPI